MNLDDETKQQEEFETYCRETRTPWLWPLVVFIFLITQIIYWTEYLNQ